MTILNPESFYMRNPAVVAAGSTRRYVFVQRKGEPVIYEHPEAALVSRIMSLLSEPIRGADLQVICESIGGRSVHLVMRLIKQRIIIVGTQPEISSLLAALELPPIQPVCNNLVVGITGAVQAPLMFSYLDQIYFRFCQYIDVILTEAALKFINPRAFEYLYDARVWIDPFKAKKNINVPHIYLAQSADLIVVGPTTAHTLHRLATGECSDLLSLVIAATSAPVVLVPAMNRAMWFHPPIQRNVSRLREDGFYIVEPGLGYEASAKHKATLQVGGPGVDCVRLLALLEMVLSLEARTNPSAGGPVIKNDLRSV